MYIKLDGENIVGHTYENLSDGSDYDAQIPDTVLVDFETSCYKYKFVDNELIELSQEERENHPLLITRYTNKFKEEIKNLLKETDYTQLADLPISDEDRLAFKAYRAALRDLEYGDEIPSAPIYVKSEE